MLNDITYALRGLRRAPGFAFVAILALALGIGANSAVFSVVDRVLLRPLDSDGADRVVGLWAGHPEFANSPGVGAIGQPSYPDFADWKAQTPALAGAAFVRGDGFLMKGPEGAERLLGAKVSEGFFGVIGARAA